MQTKQNSFSFIQTIFFKNAAHILLIILNKFHTRFAFLIADNHN